MQVIRKTRQKYGKLCKLTHKQKTLGFTLRSPFNLVMELAETSQKASRLRGQGSNLRPIG